MNPFFKLSSWSLYNASCIILAWSYSNKSCFSTSPTYSINDDEGFFSTPCSEVHALQANLSKMFSAVRSFPTNLKSFILKQNYC